MKLVAKAHHGELLPRSYSPIVSHRFERCACNCQRSLQIDCICEAGLQLAPAFWLLHLASITYLAHGILCFWPMIGLHIWNYLVADAMPPTPFSASRVYGRCISKTVMNMDGMLAFFDIAFSSDAYCAAGTPFTETELSPVFRCTSLYRCVMCGRFASKKCNLHGRNSRHFFHAPL